MGGESRWYSESSEERVHSYFTSEPGYIATSAMLVQSALTLLDERDAMPKK